MAVSAVGWCSPLVPPCRFGIGDGMRALDDDVVRVLSLVLVGRVGPSVVVDRS